MGCGCKNNGSQNPPPPPPPPQNPAPQQNRAGKEDVRASIKKTIEKFYNVNKTKK